MEQYNEEIFEAVTDIVASALEENEVDISAEGGRKVAEFFMAIYDALEAKEAPKGRYEVYQDKNGEYRFRLKAGNHEVIAVSEGYQSKAACLKGIESVRRNAAAEVAEE